MREIKFRAWHAEKRFMDAIDGYNLMLTNDGIVDVYEIFIKGLVE